MAKMISPARIPVFILTLASILSGLPHPPVVCGTGILACALFSSPFTADAEPPDEVRALVERAIANQHRNDVALAEYERLERRVALRGENDEGVRESETLRVVPTGTGTLRLLVEKNGRRVEPEFYRKQLRDLEQALVWALDPQEARQKQRVEKWAKRAKERAEMVDAVREAFRFTWLGREERNGRTLVKLRFDLNPEFKLRSRTTQMFAHVRAVVWIDEAAGQLARVEAEIIRDISFGGGVLGKVYRGGRFVLEQQEVSEGIWLPSLYILDFRGRKFLFGAEIHDRIEASGYRRIGPPSQALAAVRRELVTGQAANSSP